MPSIDERIVSMAFENAKFEAAVAATMATLAKLDTTLKNIGAANSLADIEKAASKITLEQPISALDKLRSRLAGASQGAADGLGGIEQAGNKVTLEGPVSAIDKLQGRLATVGSGAADSFGQIESASNGVTIGGMSAALTGVTGQFSVMQGAAAVALGNIASQAINAGSRFVKAFAFEPVSAGFKNYETQINAVQTIMANTGLQGEKGLGKVSAKLDELNEYANKTVYNFSEMAKNIGTFTAAGVDLDTATGSIKGIANLAALSGSSSLQASTAMYQLSQAIAAGKVQLLDWKSVENAGMGGAVFQKALFNTAKAMGTLKDVPVGQTFDEWKKANGSFRNSLSATHKAATDSTSAIAKAQKDGAEAVKSAQADAADAVTNAAQRVKDAQESQTEAITNAAKRVKDAQEAQATAVQNAADRLKQAQENAAEAATAAAEKVKAAHKGVSETAKQSAQDLKDAQQAQKDTFVQTAADVKSALDSVTEARKRLEDALKPPSADEQQAAADKLKGAQLDQADLATAVSDAQREQKRSAEDLATAQKHLTDVQTGGNPDEIRAATRALEDAQKRQADDADAVERAILAQNAATRDLHQAQTDLTDVQNKGTESDQKVLDARDALTIATDNYAKAQKTAAAENAAAEKNVTDIRLKGIEERKKAAQDLADAEKEESKVTISGRKAVAEAEKAQAKTIIDSRESVAEAEKAQAKTIRDSRKSVADAEEEQAKTIIDSRKRVADAEATAAERITSAREKIDGGSQGAPSWLTSDVLTNTLKQFTGDLSEAQLKAQGFNDEQIKAIMKTAEIAKGAAVNIKTFSQMTSALKEEVASAWATVFKTVFGDIFSATKLFTGMHQVAQDALTGPVYAINKVLQEWAKLGGRATFLDAIKQGFHDIQAVIQPVKDAFRDIFPPATAQDLLDLTRKFSDLTEKLKPSAETVDNIRRTFRGFFAVLHIGWTIIKDVIGVIGDLFGVVGQGGGGFLKFTGTIGDLATALDKALTQGTGLKKFFDGISSVLQLPLKLFTDLAGLIFSIFGTATDSGGLTGSMDQVNKASGPLASVLDNLKKAWDGFVHILGQAKELVSPWLDAIGTQMSTLGTTLADAFRNMDFNAAMSALQTGFLGAIFFAIKKGITGGVSELGSAVGGLNKVFGALTGNLQAMQRDIQANTLLQIAAAIGLLAAAVFVLAKIDPKRLASALTAMAVGMAELMLAVKLMSSGMGAASIATLPLLAAGLIGITTAVVIMAGAMKIFATMKWEEIAKGLAGMGGGLAAIGIGMKFIGGKELLIQAPALIAIAIAMNLLAIAVKQFASMKWEDLARGIAGMLGALIAVAVPLTVMGPELLLVAPGLLAAAVAMNFLALAVKAFASIDPKRMFIGIAGMAAAMLVMAPAVTIMALALPGAVALAAAAAGVTILAFALGLFGSLSLASIGKGLLAMGGSLAILAIGLTAMIAAAPGAVALLAASVALAILAPTLGFMGTLNWGTIIKGLIGIALVMGTLSLVGLVASAGLEALGIALLPLAAVLLISAGAVLLFAKALSLMGDSGAKGVGVMVAAITAFIALLPSMAINLVKGMVEIIGGIADVAPKVVEALGKILDSVITFVLENAGRFAVAFGSLIDAAVAIVVENAPKIIAAGFGLLLAFLKGVDDNIEEVVTRVVSILTKFMTTLTDHAPDLIAAGVKLLVTCLNGIASKIGDLVTAAIGLVTSFITAVVGQLPKVLLQGADLVAKLIIGILGKVKDVIAAGLSIILSVITGIGNALPRVVTAAGDVVKKFVNAVADVGPDLVDAGFKALIKFLHGIAQAIRDNNKDLVDAGIDIATAIADGLVDGLGAVGSRLIKPAIEKLFSILPGWARKVLGINSPSKVFMEIGQYSAQGLVVGLQNGSANVANAAGDMGDTAVSSLKGTMNRISNVLDTGIDSSPKITPVLDLTQVKSGMGDLNKMTTSTQPQFAVASSLMGRVVSSETQTQQDATSQASSSQPVVQLTQNNYSPESLNPTEIYRQTNNQLSQVKRSLGLGDGRTA